MNSCNRPVQTFVAPELHRALKVRAAQDRTSVTAIVRGLIASHVARADGQGEPSRADRGGELQIAGSLPAGDETRVRRSAGTRQL